MESRSIEIHRTGLSETIYERILLLIVEEKFPENSRLPSEQELARQFNVSRPVLREALARLREDGLIATRQGSGTYILRKPDKTVVELAPLESIADIQNCFKFRIGIEGEAAYFAAVHHTPETFSAIEHSLIALGANEPLEEIGVNADFALHLNIARASENRFFISALEMIESHIGSGMRIARSLSLRRTQKRMAEVHNEHRAIADAIYKREPEPARNAMRTHLENARKRIFEGDFRR